MIRFLPLLILAVCLIILVVQFVLPSLYKKVRTREEEIKKDIEDTENELSTDNKDTKNKICQDQTK